MRDWAEHSKEHQMSTEASAPTTMSPEDEKLWAALVHLAGMLGYLFGFVLLGFVPALIGYLLLRDRGPFIRAHTATALNFQISMLIYNVIGGILSLLLMIISVTVGVYTLVLVPAAIALFVIAFSIVAAVTANKGYFYSYPLTIRFFS